MVETHGRASLRSIINKSLNYVWKKLHVKRTGMWEIPILKWVENNQVKKELEKRQGAHAPENVLRRRPQPRAKNPRRFK